MMKSTPKSPFFSAARAVFGFTRIKSLDQLKNPRVLLETTWKLDPYQIIVTAQDLPRGIAKRKDLMQVVFTGGLNRGNLGSLNVGGRDTQVFKVQLQSAVFRFDPLAPR